MNWKYIIISIISFGIGFLVGWGLTFEIVRNFVLAGLSIGVVIEVGGFLIGIYRDKRERKLVHSEILIDNNLRINADKQINYANKHKFGLDIQVLPETQNDKIYSKEVNCHLEWGYPKIWDILNKRDRLIKEHNELSNLFLEELYLKISDNIKQLIPDEWDVVNSLKPEPNHYRTIYFNSQVIEIIKNIQFYNENMYPPRSPLSFSVLPEGANKWKLSFVYPLVISDNKEELDNLQKWIKDTFNDSIISVTFDKLKKYSVDINNEHKNFINEIFIIIKRVEYGTPLNSNCETCQKEWWELW